MDMLGFPNKYGNTRVAVFRAGGVGDWQTWQKVPGCSFATIICFGGGGGGGAGFTRIAGAAGGGGGGGGSSANSRLIIPYEFIHDLLYLNVGPGGAAGSAGNLSYVSARPDTLARHLLLVSGAAAAGAGGTGTGAAVGAAGVAGTIATALVCGVFSGMGSLTFVAGASGTPGGAVAGANGGNFTYGAFGAPISGGTGGGGTTSADFTGGIIISSGIFPQLNGGAAGTRGADGFNLRSPFSACGGTGGGSSNASVAGDGGNGGIGSGGGGGGAGATGGAGGTGGGGIIFIISN